MLPPEFRGALPPRSRLWMASDDEAVEQAVDNRVLQVKCNPDVRRTPTTLGPKTVIR